MRKQYAKRFPEAAKSFFIRPYPSAANPTAWAALYGLRTDNDLTDAEVGLYQVSGAGIREICHTSGSTSLVADGGPLYGAMLYLFPIAGRATPEIVVCGAYDHNGSQSSPNCRV